MVGNDIQSLASRPVKERVFVSGVGPICPAGVGIESLGTHFWRIANYEDTNEECQDTPDVLTVPEFDLADYIPTTRPYVDHHSECMLASASMALGWPGSEEVDVDQARCGLATGTMFGNVSSMETFQKTVKAKGMRLASPVLFPHCYANTSNSLLSIEFGLRGYNENYCGDHLCGATALQTAFEALRQGRADLMLAGGGDVMSEKFRDLITKEETETSIPMGEGVSLLGLETEKSLSIRGMRPLCEIAAVVTRGTGLKEPVEGELARDQFPAVVESVVGAALEDAEMWEGDIGAVFTTIPWEQDEWIEPGMKEALSGYSALPHFSEVPTAGHTWAAAYPLQCTLAAMVLRQRELPTPPHLESVQEGVETWKEEGPTTLLGKGVLVLGCTRRQIVATVLKESD